jgi:acetyl-CoA acetyltransferase
MGNDVYIAGIGMTRFTIHLDKTYHELGAGALNEVFNDAILDRKNIEGVFFSNSFWGHFEGQHCIRGQCVLRPYGLLGIPIINVENACASGSTALYSGYMALKSGEFDAVLCLGVEKIAHPDKVLALASFTGGFDRTDLEDTFNLYNELSAQYAIPMPADDGLGKSQAMETYGVMSRWHMWKYGSTQKELAKIAVKNRFNGSLNPNAHWQEPVSLEKVMTDRVISYPITRPMCAPVGDGAAAVILVSERYLSKLKGPKPVKIRAMAHTSGSAKRSMDEVQDVGERLAELAYDKAGLGPEDIDIAEVHDATAFGELHQTEALGFTSEGAGGDFIESGKSALDGELPINTSGGLISRGHPVGASGLGQIFELVTQMRGEAGKRQVPKDVRIAMAENGGGIMTLEEASMTLTILEKVK